MFGRGLGPGRLEVDRLCAQVIESAKNPTSAACADAVNELTAVLERRRKDNLAAFGSGLAMVEIDRVYAALSWLLREDGGANLADSARAAVFRCLKLLAQDWYPAWNAREVINYKRWQTLVGIGVYLLLRGAQLPNPTAASSPSPKVAKGPDEKTPPKPVALGEATRIEILGFIDAMLCPRTEKRKAASSSAQEQDAWEWDGVSELPSLQDALDFFEYDPDFNPKKKGKAKAESEEVIHTLFPTTDHLKWAAQGKEVPRMLMQVCVLSLDIASSPQYSELLRATALRASRTTFATWLVEANETVLQSLASMDGAALRSKTFDKPTLNLAIRAQGILPGMVSALIKILTGRGTGATTTEPKQRALPSKAGLAALALEILRDISVMGFDDRATAKVRAAHGPRAEGLSKISTLDDLADLAATISTSDAGEPSSILASGGETTAGTKAQDANLPPQAKMFLTSTQRMSTALKQVLSTFQGIPQIHHSTLLAALDMAGILFLRIGETLSWAEALSEGQEIGQSSRCEDLLRLIVDIAASARNVSHAVEARAWDVLLGLVASKSSQEESVVTGRTIDSIGQLALGLMDRIASSALEELPLALHSDNDDQIALLSSRITVACTFFQKLAEESLLQDAALNAAKRHSSQALSLLFLVHGPHSTSTTTWTTSPAFSRWSATLLSGLEILDSADVAEVDSTVSGIAVKLKKLSQGSQRAVQEALGSISTAVTSSWSSSLQASQPTPKAKKARVEDQFGFAMHFLHEGARYRTARLTSEADLARRMCSSALFVADELMSAVASSLLKPNTRSKVGNKERRKTARKLGKVVTQLVKAMLEEDLDEAMDPDNVLALVADRERGGAVVSASQETDAGATIEYQKGMGAPVLTGGPGSAGPSDTGLIDAGLVNAVNVHGPSASKAALSAVVQQEKALRQVHVANALLLNLLATAAELLGRDFESQLISLIYPLVCASTADSGIVRAAAQSALARIASACGYGGPKDVLRACADWIVSSTSQRIVTDLGSELELVTQAQSAAEALGRGLDGQALIQATGTLGGCALPLGSAQGAPFVLVEFVRMLGAEALVSVEDAVDEVLDALDRYHGYEEICDGLLSVLRALLAASAESLKTVASAATSDKDVNALKEADWLPKRNEELDAFEQWFKGRHEPERLDFPEEGTSTTSGKFTARAEDKSEEDAVNPPPTRSQQIVAEILDKTLAFLGHSLAHIRAQVLRLLGYGVSVLAAQGRELELIPVLNRAWPHVLARLGFSATTPAVGQQGHRLRAPRQTMLGKRTEAEPIVWLEAVDLVASLAQHCPEYFGQKIVDDAWPRLQLLLADLSNLQPTHPAERITSDRAPYNTTPRSAPTRPLFVPDEHSLGSRLYSAALSALHLAVHGVSIHLDETQAWGIATDPMILGALHGRQAPAVRQGAEQLFLALGQRNRDATWVLLREFVVRPRAKSVRCLTALGRGEVKLDVATWQRLS